MGAGMPNKVWEYGNTTPTAIKLRNSENCSSHPLGTLVMLTLRSASKRGPSKHANKFESVLKMSEVHYSKVVRRENKMNVLMRT